MAERDSSFTFDMTSENARVATDGMLAIWHSYFDGYIGVADIVPLERDLQQLHELPHEVLSKLSFMAFEACYIERNV